MGVLCPAQATVTHHIKTTLLVDGLAQLCGLRDRAALDDALVALMVQTGQPQVRLARLVRLVGDEQHLHCLTRAQRQHGKPQGDRLPAWVDWKDLPPLSQFPLRQQVRLLGQTQAQAAVQAQEASGAPWVTVMPVGRQRPPLNFLEIESDAPLAGDLLALLEGVVQLYSNFEGLLDYGEKDALTELLNRKTFDGAFARAAIELALPDDTPLADRRTYRAEESYWLAVVDIDHFKRVNDSFGHLIGDEVLLLMARLMRTSFRFHDQLYRFGGEEFVILMRCGGYHDARGALERFRHRVESFEFPQVGHITVSIGFDGLRGDDTPGVAFGRADKAVYHAKAHGRNQVISYQGLIDSGEVVEARTPDTDIDFF